MQSLKNYFDQNIFIILCLVTLVSCFGAGWNSFETEYISFKNIPMLVYLALLAGGAYHLVKSILKKLNWSNSDFLAIFATSLGSTLLLHFIYPNGPWHILSIHNDASHSLNMAREMANGDYTLSLFLPHWMGRVALTMSIESLYFKFANPLSLNFLIWLMQGLFASLLVTVAAQTFQLQKTPLWKLLICSCLLSFCPYVFFSSVHMDMYWLAPLWVLLGISLYNADFEDKNSKLLLWGLLVGAGIFIAPSTKMLSPLLFLAILFSHRRALPKMLPFVIGYAASLLAYLALWLKFQDALTGRETWLFNTLFINEIKSSGFFEVILERLKLIHYNLFQGQFVYFIFARVDRLFDISNPISMFSWPLFFSIYPLWKKPKLLMLCLSLLAVTLLQLIVAEPADYRAIHALPAWGIALAFSFFMLMENDWRSKFMGMIPIIIQLHFLTHIYSQMDYRYINTNFERNESLWTSIEPAPENTQVAAMQMGTAELFQTQKSTQLGINFGVVSEEEKMGRIRSYLKKYESLKLRMSTTEFKKMESAMNSIKERGYSIEATRIESQLWPGQFGYEVLFTKL